MADAELLRPLLRARRKAILAHLGRCESAR